VLDALRSRAATLRVVLASFALVAGMFVFVFPTRTWWSQRQQVNSARSQLALLHEQNDALTRQAKELRSDAEIKRRAREDFGYVMPGERSYTAIPAPPTTTTTTTPTTTAPPAPTTATTAAPPSTTKGR
jgi:cell division protein FtsB